MLGVWELIAGQEIGAARPEVTAAELNEQITAETWPMLADSGLYKRTTCEKMVMGLEIKNRQKEKLVVKTSNEKGGGETI